MSFRTILADPPWPYDGKGPVGTGGRGAAGIRSLPHPGSVERYGSMSIEELCSLKPPSDNNAHLYLWTTNSFIVEAHTVARSWGFEPKTMITWVKISANGLPSMKTGYYYRGATEHMLFCVKGSQKLQGPARPTAFLSPRLPHSVKPEWSYQLIEEQSPTPFLEMFARTWRPGWQQCGNEILNPLDYPLKLQKDSYRLS